MIYGELGQTAEVFNLAKDGIQLEKVNMNNQQLPNLMLKWLNLINYEDKWSQGVTRRERLKSALYLRLKKRKTFFFGKKLEIFGKKISFGKCRTVPENVRGGTLFDL